MSVSRFLSDLIGTMAAYFRVGGGSGFRLSNSSGTCNVENAGGTSKAPLGTHTLNLHGSNATNKISITAPAGLGGDVNFVFPDNDGSANQLMGTDGSGNLSFYDAVSSGELCQQEAFTQGTSSPMTIFTPPANAVITRVQIEVTSAASAGAPLVSVGIAADNDRDMETTQSDLKTAGLYEVTPMSDVGGTPGAINLYITPDSQTFSGETRVWYVVPQ